MKIKILENIFMEEEKKVLNEEKMKNYILIHSKLYLL